jgi:hypothetical protein
LCSFPVIYVIFSCLMCMFFSCLMCMFYSCVMCMYCPGYFGLFSCYFCVFQGLTLTSLVY